MHRTAVSSGKGLHQLIGAPGVSCCAIAVKQGLLLTVQAILQLAEIIQARVYDESGVRLEMEVRIIG